MAPPRQTEDTPGERPRLMPPVAPGALPTHPCHPLSARQPRPPIAI